MFSLTFDKSDSTPFKRGGGGGGQVSAINIRPFLLFPLWYIWRSQRICMYIHIIMCVWFWIHISNFVVDHFQLKPWRWSWIWKVKKAVMYLRDYGKRMMKKRQDAINSGDHVPDDVLTYILKLKGTGNDKWAYMFLCRI